MNRLGQDELYQEVHFSLAQAIAAGESCHITVSGACMEPHLHDGDKVVVIEAARIWPGDVLVYYCGVNKSHVVHRYLGWLPRASKARYLFKSDAGVTLDGLVTRDQILGKVGGLPVPFSQRLLSIKEYLAGLSALVTLKLKPKSV